MAACEHGAGYASCPTGMTHQQMHDFAATPRKGLPVRVQKLAEGGLVENGNNPEHFDNELANLGELW